MRVRSPPLAGVSASRSPCCSFDHILVLGQIRLRGASTTRYSSVRSTTRTSSRRRSYSAMRFYTASYSSKAATRTNKCSAASCPSTYRCTGRVIASPRRSPEFLSTPAEILTFARADLLRMRRLLPATRTRGADCARLSVCPQWLTHRLLARDVSPHSLQGVAFTPAWAESKTNLQP